MWKGRNESWHDFLCKSTKKLLELINESRKILRLKTNTQKSIVFSYSNKQMEGFPLVQWLRLCFPNAGGPGSIPCQGTRSHMPKLRVCMSILKIPYAATKAQYSLIILKYKWKWNFKNYNTKNEMFRKRSNTMESRSICWKLTLMKQIKEALNKWETYHVHGFKNSVLLKCQFSKLIYRFKQKTNENPSKCSYRNRQLDSKIYINLGKISQGN